MVTADFREGIKKQVAEIKFLIHDLRVDRFINNIIHFHVTLNADLEIFNVEQALALHADDLTELRQNAATMRQALRDYSTAVKNFSPDNIVIATGRRFVETIQEICDLILNPLWGRFDKVISFLPEDSRSAQSRNHYRNNIRWICGVYYRIEYFFQELDNVDVREEFDAGDDIIDYTNNVIFGYIVEKSQARVEIQIDRKDRAVLYGNRPRFRRMFFNMVMNAVDALKDKPVGMINVTVWTEGDRVLIAVQDNGVGMYPDKIKHLLRDLATLDGVLHSLGFVFVRQTVESWGGELEVASDVGKGSTITIKLPYLPDRDPPPRRKSKCQHYAVMPFEESTPSRSALVLDGNGAAGSSAELSSPDAGGTPQLPDGGESKPSGPEQPAEKEPADSDTEDPESSCGRIIYRDYRLSQARSPGCIFAIGVTYDNKVDTFVHKPYEEQVDLSHEDLSPMLYDSTIRGRLEENDEKLPVLILKEPHNSASYFDLKEISEDRSAERYVDMIHDEYILIGRKLLATGMRPDVRVHVTSAARFLPGFEELLGPEPFPLERLAELALSTE